MRTHSEGARPALRAIEPRAARDGLQTIAAETNEQAWSQVDQSLKYTNSVPPSGEIQFSFSVTATPIGGSALQPFSAIAIIKKMGG